MGSQWYIHVSGQSQGPYSGDQLREMTVSGHLKPEDYVWSPEMPDWISAKEVSGLFASASPTPPPHPGQHAAGGSPKPPSPGPPGGAGMGHQGKKPVKKKNTALIVVLVVLVGIVVFVGGLIGLGWWAWSAFTSNGYVESVLEEVFDDVPITELQDALDEEFGPDTWDVVEEGLGERGGTAPQDFSAGDAVVEDHAAVESTIPSEPREQLQAGPPYGGVSEALFYYMVDSLKHTDFHLLSEDELAGYDMEEFYQKYGDGLVYIYNFEQTGNEIEVDMGEPYSGYFFSLILEWDGSEWQVIRYLE